MSTNYFPYCVDCQSEHPVDPDRMLEACRVLIRHAKVIGNLVELYDGLSEAWGSPEFNLSYNSGRIDPHWFRKHAQHQLVVRDEYGKNDDECGESYQCTECTHPHHLRCRRPPKHEGFHNPRRDDGK